VVIKKTKFIEFLGIVKT